MWELTNIEQSRRRTGENGMIKKKNERQSVGNVHELYPSYTELSPVIAIWFEKGNAEQKTLAHKFLSQMATICDHNMSVALGGDPKKKNKNYEEAINLMTGN